MTNRPCACGCGEVVPRGPRRRLYYSATCRSRARRERRGREVEKLARAAAAMPQPSLDDLLNRAVEQVRQRLAEPGDHRALRARLLALANRVPPPNVDHRDRAGRFQGIAKGAL